MNNNFVDSAWISIYFREVTVQVCTIQTLLCASSLMPIVSGAHDLRRPWFTVAVAKIQCEQNCMGHKKQDKS